MTSTCSYSKMAGVFSSKKAHGNIMGILSHHPQLCVNGLSIELAKGCYISAYRWNSGGVWKGRTWDQDLPNDSQVL